LYDQLDNAGTVSTGSQDFEAANDAFDNQTADDFVVPGGQSWQVTEVDATGVYFNGPGPAASFNVYFYTSVVSGTYTIPGTPVYTATAQTYINSAGVFQITLGSPANLTSGTYFVSVQARQDFTPAGQWGWTDRTVQANQAATWRNPAGGFANACTNWDRRFFCTGSPAGENDQMFRLIGTVSAGPTATPPPCGGPGIPGTWTAVPTVVAARSRLGLAYFAPNGKFYMLGGETTGGNRNIPFEEYDPVANAWASRATPIVGVSNTGAGTVGNYIYVPGGYDGVIARTEMQRYDPVANAVATVSPMPAGNYAHAVAVQGTRVYVLGGSSTGAAGTTNYIYDTGTGVWSTGAAVPTAVQYPAAASDGTYIYLLGGNTTDLNTVQRYDPAANSWSARAPMLQGRGGPAAFFDGTYVWVVGGGWTTYLTSTEYSNPATDTWTAGPPLNVGVRTVGAAFGNNMAIKAAGWRGSYEGAAEKLPFTVIPCPTSTPTSTSTSTSIPTSTATSTPAVTSTPTACPIEFTDVLPGSTFYDFVRCMACRGIITGYTSGCETGNPCFRPGNQVTRGQLSKIAANAAGFNEPVGAQQYEDVAPGSTFYDFIWRLTDRGLVNGYPCGGAGEPCVPPGNLPYFRPNANVTRGQLSKIVANAAGLSQPVGAQQFEDVAPGSTFYDFIWRLTDLGVMGGYDCGGPGEPCVPPGNLPYFRPGANATRGQASKIVSNTFFPGCSTPAQRTR
jgi:hypothetical protein